MFWYDLCLLITASAIRVLNEGNQTQIPEHIVNGLIDNLMDISEYALGLGDMQKRVFEALANTLLAFYSTELIDRTRQKGHAAKIEVKRFVEATIRRVNEMGKDA